MKLKREDAKDTDVKGKNIEGEAPHWSGVMTDSPHHLRPASGSLKTPL